MNFIDKVTHVDKYAARLFDIEYDWGFINYRGLIRKLDIESKKKEVLLTIHENFENSPNKSFCDKNNNYVLMINLLYNTIKEIKIKQQANDNT